MSFVPLFEIHASNLSIGRYCAADVFGLGTNTGCQPPFLPLADQISFGAAVNLSIVLLFNIKEPQSSDMSFITRPEACRGAQ